MDRRFLVSVPRTEAHFVDASGPEDAIAAGIELARQGARPAYVTEPTANVEAFAEQAA